MYRQLVNVNMHRIRIDNSFVRHNYCNYIQFTEIFCDKHNIFRCKSNKKNHFLLFARIKIVKIHTILSLKIVEKLSTSTYLNIFSKIADYLLIMSTMQILNFTNAWRFNDTPWPVLNRRKSIDSTELK